MFPIQISNKFQIPFLEKFRKKTKQPQYFLFFMA